MLLISLTLSAIFLPKIKSATNASSSVSAIYAADSGIEWCLYTNRGKTPARPTPTLTNGATYTITPSDCMIVPLNHQAVGTYHGVSRALQVQSGSAALVNLALGKPVSQSIADHQPCNFPASNMTDGDLNTLAYPCFSSFSYTVDLGSLQTVTEINAVVKGYGHTDIYVYITSWQIEGYNGSSWTTLGSGGSPESDTITIFPSATISQIRISAQSTAHQIGIYELQAY